MHSAEGGVRVSVYLGFQQLPEGKCMLSHTCTHTKQSRRACQDLKARRVLVGPVMHWFVAVSN